jgi:hypothetical protein
MPSGNVGIGTLSPNHKLQVQGNGQVNGTLFSYNINNVSEMRTNYFYAVSEIATAGPIITTAQATAAILYATDKVIGINSINTNGSVYINTYNVPFTSYVFTNVTEYNGSRMLEFPIRATNAYIYLYFGDIGSHTLFIKTGNTYNKRMGAGGNGWDFSESYNGNVRNWYHWRSVGDRITAICLWWN